MLTLNNAARRLHTAISQVHLPIMQTGEQNSPARNAFGVASDSRSGVRSFGACHKASRLTKQPDYPSERARIGMSAGSWRGGASLFNGHSLKLLGAPQRVISCWRCSPCQCGVMDIFALATTLGEGWVSVPVAAGMGLRVEVEHGSAKSNRSRRPRSWSSR
jgi:hypothetical protein